MLSPPHTSTAGRPMRLWDIVARRRIRRKPADGSGPFDDPLSADTDASDADGEPNISCQPTSQRSSKASSGEAAAALLRAPPLVITAQQRRLDLPPPDVPGSASAPGRDAPAAGPAAAPHHADDPSPPAPLRPSAPFSRMSSLLPADGILGPYTVGPAAAGFGSASRVCYGCRVWHGHRTSRPEIQVAIKSLQPPLPVGEVPVEVRVHKAVTASSHPNLVQFLHHAAVDISESDAGGSTGQRWTGGARDAGDRRSAGGEFGGGSGGLPDDHCGGTGCRSPGGDRAAHDYPNEAHGIGGYAPRLRPGVRMQQHFLVMEACAGGDLFNLLEQAGGPLDGELVRRLFRGVVAGLLHLHSLGVAHRDIKPEVRCPRIGWPENRSAE